MGKMIIRPINRCKQPKIRLYLARLRSAESVTPGVQRIIPLFNYLRIKYSRRAAKIRTNLHKLDYFLKFNFIHNNLTSVYQCRCTV